MTTCPEKPEMFKISGRKITVTGKASSSKLQQKNRQCQQATYQIIYKCATFAEHQ